MRTFLRKYSFIIGTVLIMIAVPYLFISLSKKSTPPTITIWIHGTGPKGIFPKKIAQFVSKQAKSFLYCKPGLNKALELPKHYHHYKIAKKLWKKDPQRFPKKWFYLFGWSGGLDSDTRKHAAEKLFKQLKKLVAKYKATYYCQPKIRIITHSHGGNVVLNLAQVKNNRLSPIIIDELILLACPVQEETKLYVKHPMFKKIYSIHSHFDAVQVLDPQGWPLYKEKIKQIFSASSFHQAFEKTKELKDEKLFSDRHFPKNSKVFEIRYKSKYRDITHIEFILLPFIKKIPDILNKIENFNAQNPSKKELSINTIH